MQVSPPPGALPPRIYLPIVAVVSILFLILMAYLINLGFGVTGSLFGKGASVSSAQRQAARAGAADSVQGGPPAAVMLQLQTLRARVAKDPHDDVSLTQLGDLYLAANKYAQAIPYYVRALKANPSNVAAQTGLQEAKSALAQQQSTQ